MEEGAQPQMQSPYQTELKTELSKLNPEEFSHAVRLLNEENKRVESGDKYKAVTTIELHTNKPASNALKIRIPVKEYPRYNFVGKLLGPKGNTLKQMQQESGCKLSILGRGSMRDKQKEEELRQEGGKYSHLNEELHVMVECFAEGSDAYGRIAHAVNQIKRFMVPEDADGLLQPEEMGFANGEGGMGRGGMGRGLLSTPGPRGGMGRGGMTGRGGAAPFGSPNGGGGRGGGGAPRGAPAMRGAPSMRGGAPASRGSPSTRGAPPSRGAPAMSWGGNTSAPRGRGGMAPPQRAAPMQQAKFDDYGASKTGFEADPYAQESSAYTEAGYGRRDPYAEEQAYAEPVSSAADTQYFDYGHGAQGGYGEYDDGSRGAGGYDRAGMKAAAPSATRPSARGGMFRAHPYETQGRDSAASRMGGRPSAY